MIIKGLVFLLAVCLGLVGTWFALRFALHTDYPLLPVSSAGMCTCQLNCDGFTHPLEPTLHIGDLVIVQGVNAENVSDAYPNSDILVFFLPKSDSYQDDALALARVVEKKENGGLVYFRTKSDGKGVHLWPEMPNVSECDYWCDYRENCTLNGMISEKLLVGKVVSRIPLIGHIALFLNSTLGILVVVALIVAVLIVTSAAAKFRKKAEAESEERVESAPPKT
jgi:hypothetical protein